MKISNTSARLKEAMNRNKLRAVDLVNKCKPLCEKYGVKMEKNDISQYLSGKYEPTQNKLSLLAEVLNVDEVWLMGYDVPKESKNILNEMSLDVFLNSIKYDDIENKVRNDKNKLIISYVDFYDILLYIYPNKFDLLEKEKSFFNDLPNKLESVLEQSNNISIKKSIIKINDAININQLNDSLISLKKNKLFYSIKKYYSKNDILKEIDKRNYFEITDKSNNLIVDENERLDLIEITIEKILRNIKI